MKGVITEPESQEQQSLKCKKTKGVCLDRRGKILTQTYRVNF